MSSVDEPAPPRARVRDAARTKAEILDVATREFARAGYDGARVDRIATLTRTR
ncbi:HTH-type transcriptional repressor [Streptomyces sp. MBT84]|uniref:TetR family transcriptional regulator n=1 Tax=Streptomyces lannensis TaxID=766498 RepID=A0ABP7LWA7_9ACTN|nr:HTH-type transcriptional repressor [Streptomyces sp. MBT84]